MELKAGEYLGECSTRKIINGLLITTSHHLQYHKISWHHHSNPYYSLVLKGKYREYYNRESIAVIKGDVVFHPPQILHSNAFESLDTTCLNIEFTNEWLERFDVSSSKMQQQPLINDDFQKVLINKMAKETMEPDAFSDMSILGLAAELTRNISAKEKKEKSIPLFLRQVKNYLSENYFLTPTLHELSKMADVSEEHLCREFKNKFGTTLGEYIRQKRITRACQLLGKKNLPIEQIAFELGFTDASHFNKVFKRMTGLSPSGYRSSL